MTLNAEARLTRAGKAGLEQVARESSTFAPDVPTQKSAFECLELRRLVGETDAEANRVPSPEDHRDNGGDWRRRVDELAAGSSATSAGAGVKRQRGRGCHKGQRWHWTFRRLRQATGTWGDKEV